MLKTPSFPFNPQRALRTLARETTAELERPQTPSQFDIFNQVYINSSPPDIQVLRQAKVLLSSALDTLPGTTSPVRRYIRKLAAGAEQSEARSIVHQHDANNLRSIIKKRTTRKKGKRVVLKGHFHISTQELCDAVVEAEKATKERMGKRTKIKGKATLYNIERGDDIGEEDKDESESNFGDCIIVDC